MFLHDSVMSCTGRRIIKVFDNLRWLCCSVVANIGDGFKKGWGRAAGRGCGMRRTTKFIKRCAAPGFAATIRQAKNRYAEGFAMSKEGRRGIDTYRFLADGREEKRRYSRMEDDDVDRFDVSEK